MRRDIPQPELTPREFEDWIARWFKASGSHLRAFEVVPRTKLVGSDGSAYEIDVLVRFEELGAMFTVLVEAKHWKAPVGRDVVQVLHSRLMQLGAQKGMLFTTSSFERGALSYAKQYGIALVVVADGRTCYETKSLDLRPVDSPPWANIPGIIGWVQESTATGYACSLLSEARPDPLLKFLGMKNAGKSRRI